jgi:hypothetical protein
MRAAARSRIVVILVSFLVTAATVVSVAAGVTPSADASPLATASTAVSGSPGVAAFTAPVAAVPGQQLNITVASSACAGQQMALTVRYSAVSGVTETADIGTLASDNTGTATFAATVPASAAKTSEGTPLYWVASSANTACEATLSPVAGQTTVNAAKTAALAVSGTAAHPEMALSGCAGGLADVYVVDKNMAVTEIGGLALKSGKLTATLTVPKGSRALYVDCLQATVPGFTGRGVALPGGGPAPAQNTPGAGPKPTPRTAARWAAQGCAPSSTAYGWPLLCGTGSPFVAAIQYLATSPRERGLEERTLGSDLLLPAMTASDSLILAHPPNPGAIPGTSAAAAAAASHTYSETQTVGGGTVVKTVYGTDDDNFGISMTGTQIAGPDALKKANLRSAKGTLTMSEEISAASCPDANGLVKITVVWMSTLTINAVDRFGRKFSQTTKVQATGVYTVHVNDSAEYFSFDINATIVASGQAHWNGQTYSQPEEHASYVHNGFPIHTAADIETTITKLILDRSFYFVNGKPNGGASAVALTFLPAAPKAKDAYTNFNSLSKCLTATFAGPQTVNPTSASSYTLQVRPTTGGALSIPTDLTSNPGTVDPENQTATDANTLDFKFTAPPKDGQATIQVNGKSKRGILFGTYDVNINALQLTLSYTATVSDTQSCSGNNCPQQGSTGTYNFQIGATITGSTTMPLSLSGDTEQGTGTTTETVQTYQENGTFNGPAVGCDQNASGTLSSQLDGTTPGPFGGTLTLTANNGTVTGVNLTYWIFSSDNVTSASEQVTDTWNFTAPPECAGVQKFNNTENLAASYIEELDAEAGEYPGFGDPLFQLPATAWTVSPTWTAATGGVLATATVTNTDTSIGATATEKFTLSTPATAARPASRPTTTRRPVAQSQ